MNMCSCKQCASFSQKCQDNCCLVDLFKIVSEKNRLKLLCLLCKQEYCVCEIKTHVKMSQSLISHHLADLRQANLVVNQKKGRRVYYQLTNLGQQLVAALTKMKINYH